MSNRRLPPELEQARRDIEKIARSYGLDFYETIFEILEDREINEVASYGGFPVRYPSWRFGMAYDRMSKEYRYGLSKIYEMVINNDPAYAYLMRSNGPVDQKMVMAHVFGHVDFFKHNMWFAPTDRRMVDTMANHGTRVRRAVDEQGLAAVEEFMDLALAIDNLIDPFSPYSPHAPQRADARPPFGQMLETRREAPKNDAGRIRSTLGHGYMDRYLNPKDVLERESLKLQKESLAAQNDPPKPERDVLAFLIARAPLERWERDILQIVREEAYYYVPQGMTKIMNEGWATFWHSRIMTRHVLRDSDIIDFADHHSGTVGSAPGQVNPYKLGVELWRDIEDRWNRGAFGTDYEQCDDEERRRNWDTGAMLGSKRMFEIRKIYNDVTFIEEFFTDEFAREHGYFVYKRNARTGKLEIADRNPRLVKDALLRRITNAGSPLVRVENANYKNRGELFLAHEHEGADLQLDHAAETLKMLGRIWKRPVHIRTLEEGKEKILSYDPADEENVDT
ncbi:MAG: SpoVR family protein [Planctomycetes bacterium]|nr:SpoVR family protein [Planctomycetota bacterium]